MGRLSIAEVNEAGQSLQSRALNAIENVDNSRGVMDKVFGNSDATQHALDMLNDLNIGQIPTWRRVGSDIAINSQDDKVDEWVRIGKSIAANVDGYDHLGEDYTLAHIAGKAVTDTVQHIEDAVPAIGFGIGGILLVVGLVAIAVILTRAKEIRG